MLIKLVPVRVALLNQGSETATGLLKVPDGFFKLDGLVPQLGFGQLQRVFQSEALFGEYRFPL